MNKYRETISAEEWCSLFENFSYRVIMQNRNDTTFISTVWIGINDLMFETLIENTESNIYKHNTINEALEFHHRKCIELGIINIDSFSRWKELE